MGLSKGEEQVLIERAAAGDRQAAEVFIKAYQRSLYAYIFRLCGKPELAEDVVQEAFVRVLSNLDRFDPKYRFSTWLFTIARRLYVNMCQKLRPAYDSDMIGSRGGDWSSPGEESWDHERQTMTRDALQQVLLGLPERQREVVVLFHQLDWPIALIAEHLGMPEGTVKSHLHRGRKRLRELLENSALSDGALRELLA